MSLHRDFVSPTLGNPIYTDYHHRPQSCNDGGGYVSRETFTRDIPRLQPKFQRFRSTPQQEYVTSFKSGNSNPKRRHEEEQEDQVRSETQGQLPATTFQSPYSLPRPRTFPIANALQFSIAQSKPSLTAAAIASFNFLHSGHALFAPKRKEREQSHVSDTVLSVLRAIKSLTSRWSSLKEQIGAKCFSEYKHTTSRSLFRDTEFIISEQ